MSDSEAKLVDVLVTANRILANEGILDVFGHVSVRSQKNPKEFLLSCSRAPNSVKAADILRYRLDGSPVRRSQEKPYVERIIHGAIYQARPDVHAVCHTHSDGVLPFASSGEPIRPVVHVGALFWEGVGWFERYDTGGNLLVASAAEGTALADALGSRRAVVLKNHGCAVVGENLISAVMAAIYLDKNARIQLEALRLGKPFFLEREEARRAAQVFLSPLAQERAWNYWVGRLPKGWRQQAGLASHKTKRAIIRKRS
ncbi:MAG: class II aldolase/adducin family protein [Acidobacteria bacterium]|nr:class II aldolase/adducin family protein [Acidobacteriota bacterium]